MRGAGGRPGSDFMAAAEDFLSHRRIAVAGLSRDRPNPGNAIYRKLRDHGFDVVPVHPAAGEIEGDRCYPAVSEVPGSVDGVVITTHPEVTPRVVEDCARAGVRRVWIHRSVGEGSMSEEALRLCEDHGIAVLEGGCPMMVVEPDIVHRCMRWVLGVSGRLPDGTRYRAGGGGGGS